MFLLLILALTLLSFNVFAVESILIDFTLLKANVNKEELSKNKVKEITTENVDWNLHPKNLVENRETILDYSSIVGSNFTVADRQMLKISLVCYNWDVKLNSSAAHNENKANTYAIEWHTRYVKVLDDSLTDEEKMADDSADADKPGYTILGVRIKFPETPYNCWAIITPPYEIPAYEDAEFDEQGNPLGDDPNAIPDYYEKYYGKKYENGRGVIKNVGPIKSIRIRVYGCQYKNSLAILIKDDNNVVSEYHVPQYLDFDGWRELTWNNPNYITNVSNRELYIVPLYPRNMPFIKLYGFRIYRQGDQIGGDFVTYIKDVKVTYDLAVLDKDRPIDHESAWKILEQRTIAAKQREMQKIGHTQILRYIEKQKMHNEELTEETDQ
jgi:hypothetical protein